MHCVTTCIDAQWKCVADVFSTWRYKMIWWKYFAWYFILLCCTRHDCSRNLTSETCRVVHVPYITCKIWHSANNWTFRILTTLIHRGYNCNGLHKEIYYRPRICYSQCHWKAKTRELNLKLFKQFSSSSDFQSAHAPLNSANKVDKVDGTFLLRRHPRRDKTFFRSTDFIRERSNDNTFGRVGWGASFCCDVLGALCN